MGSNGKRRALVVGGARGLGRKTAERLRALDYHVVVTGRSDNDCAAADLEFYQLDLETEVSMCVEEIADLVNHIRRVDVIVYAAGAYLVGQSIDNDEQNIITQLNLNIVALRFLTRCYLQEQLQNNDAVINELIIISSTSAIKLPVAELDYSYGKAALSCMASLLAKDQDRYRKVLLVEPGGMKGTSFYNGTDRDVSEFLDAGWVAGEIMRHREDCFQYRRVRIERSKNPKSEIIE